MEQQSAEAYGRSWIVAWNAHDLDSLMAHYAEDVVFRSPFAIKVTGDPGCIIRGRAMLRAYYAKGMEEYPHFRFQLHRVGVGIDSIALNYIGVDGALANEVHVLDASGRAIGVRIHYSAAL